jgi:hypothetical protein
METKMNETPLKMLTNNIYAFRKYIAKDQNGPLKLKDKASIPLKKKP